MANLVAVGPRPALRLHPVLPLVLYTGTVPWGSNTKLEDQLDEPKSFHGFAPRWQPIFWNLADRTPEALLTSGSGWLQMMVVIRAQAEERLIFQRVFAEATRRLKERGTKSNPLNLARTDSLCLPSL
jgi:hypothetical protein